MRGEGGCACWIMLMTEGCMSVVQWLLVSGAWLEWILRFSLKK